MTLFVERGYDATTTTDISEAADVAQRTFFRHFPVKEAVLFADLPARIEAFTSFVSSHPSTSARRTLAAALEGAAREADTEADRRLHAVRMASGSQAVVDYGGGMQARWINATSAALAQRAGVDPRLDMRPGMMASGAVGALFVGSTRWALGEGEALEALVGEAFRLVRFAFRLELS